MWLLTDFLAVLWNALYWKILSEISKTAGTLDLASIWKDELKDPVDFFAHRFLSCFVCPGFSPFFKFFFFFIKSCAMLHLVSLNWK